MTRILAGDRPDPTIIRVGADYYMTHTSGCYAPGLLIWHSRNLLDWEPVIHALRQYDGDVWAPELVHHDGTFFIYYPTEGKNKVVTAPAIEGPWSDPIDLHLPHIDPGHIVGPDGKRYLHLSTGHVIELAADGLSTVGEVQKVYDGWTYPSEWRVEGKCLEAPNLVFHDGWYHYPGLWVGGYISVPKIPRMMVISSAAATRAPVVM